MPPRQALFPQTGGFLRYRVTAPPLSSGTDIDQPHLGICSGAYFGIAPVILSELIFETLETVVLCRRVRRCSPQTGVPLTSHSAAHIKSHDIDISTNLILSYIAEHVLVLPRSF